MRKIQNYRSNWKCIRRSTRSLLGPLRLKRFTNEPRNCLAVQVKHLISSCIISSPMICLTFRRIFKNIPLLRAQRQGPGSVVLLKNNDRYIFYLVTKIRYFHKPTYESLYFSLIRLKQFCICLNVKKLAMPKIGCGLDRLNWVRVKNLMGLVFDNSDVEIIVYSLPKHWSR